MHIIWSILLNFLLANAVFAADFSGPVISILDGDTIVLRNQSPERIRLSGIDCPERPSLQQDGEASRLFARLRQECHVTDSRQGQVQAHPCRCAAIGCTNVNHTLVKDGWCWWYRKYAPGDTVLERLEKNARDTKKRLWADPAPIPPWVYRKARSGRTIDRSDLVPL
jgi:micrococcal nuclease